MFECYDNPCFIVRRMVLNELQGHTPSSVPVDVNMNMEMVMLPDFVSYSESLFSRRTRYASY